MTKEEKIVNDTKKVINEGPVKSMALAGSIEPFVPGSDFDSYEDRIDQFFVVNDIKDDKKTAMFITLSGEVMYDILKSLTYPKKPSTVAYKDILELLQEHFTPKSNKRAERYKFYKAIQETGETLSDFIVRLKSLSQTCKFGDFLDTETGAGVGKFKLKILDEALTDKFINGIRNEKIKQLLFNTDTLDFEKCCQKALQHEMIEKESKSNTAQASVNAVRTENRSRSKSRTNYQSNSQTANYKKQWRERSQSQSSRKNTHGCRRCGRTHDEKSCPAHQWKCYTCNKLGHISTMCRSSSGNNKSAKSTFQKQNNESIKNLRYDETDSGNYIKQIRLDPESGEEVSDYLECDTNENIESDEAVEKHSNSNEISDFVNAVNVIHGTKRSKALDYELDIENKKVNMECDTGAVVTVMSLQEYKSKFCHVPLNKNNTDPTKDLLTISGEKLTECGKAMVTVNFCGIVRCMELEVVNTNKPFIALMGRNWLDVFFPLWRQFLSIEEQEKLNKMDRNNKVNSVSHSELISQIKSKFPRIVASGIDTPIEGYTAELVMKDNYSPIFHCAYTVPYKLKESVSEEIDRMCKQNIFRPIKHSNWASPLVVRVKANNTLRFCIDGKVTVNKYLETDHYPLPRMDDIFASLSNCNVFCVVDLTGAFKQLSVSEKSQEFLTINTHKGLFACTRLIDGVSSAPGIFQSVMDRILLGIDGVKCFIDDIIIGGVDVESCKERLFIVLERLNAHNVRINLEKCKFLDTEVKYLGHILSCNEIRPNPAKVKAILDAPAPKDLSQLQSYLGLLNYYGIFIPNLSSEISELYELLEKDCEFIWTDKLNSCFEKSKRLIIENQILTLYDPKKPIIIAADASPYGVGAALSHLVNGVEKPVLFASSTLSPAEKNYSQHHREALAIIFAVKKFYKYIYGQKFTLQTDHQSLKEIFSPKKKTPAVAAARLQRWAVIMSMYDYEIVHRSGSKMGHVDALSRLPLDESTGVDVDRINFLNFDSDSPVQFEDVQKHTFSDGLMCQVYDYVMNGWPAKVNTEIMPYFLKRKNISTEDRCLYYLNRVIIPEDLRKRVLKRLHECHTGIVRMKMMARSYVWWPMIDQDIENYVGNCLSCQQSQPVSRKPTTTSWPKTNFPFERIHIDFFEFGAKHVLLISDAHTKYCEAYEMYSTNAISVIDKMIRFFCVFGLPTELVSDNGPPFKSKKFMDFLIDHKIKHTPAPPFHPQSNGQAENAVKTIKQCFFKFVTDLEGSLTLKEKIQKFVIYHNNSPSTTTGNSPSGIIFAFKPKTLLDLINIRFKETIDQSGNMNGLNNSFKKFEFEVGQNVMYLNHFKSHVHWIPAKVIKRVSMCTYLIEVYGNIRFVHENQLKKSNLSEIHHSPRQKIFLKDVGKSILKHKEKIPVESISDDETGKKVKFSIEKKRRSVSVSDAKICEDVHSQRPKRTIMKPKTYVEEFHSFKK